MTISKTQINDDLFERQKRHQIDKWLIDAWKYQKQYCYKYKITKMKCCKNDIIKTTINHCLRTNAFGCAAVCIGFFIQEWMSKNDS